MSGYWVVCYREISDPDKVAAYGALAGPAVAGSGGRYLVRGDPAATYEAGLAARTVVVEFDSLEAALAAHETPDYQAALAVLGDGAVRDLRILPGAGG